MENQNSSIAHVESQVDISTISQEDFIAAMEKSDSKQLKGMEVLMDLTAEYVELEKTGESFRGVYIGFQDMNITDKQTGESKKLKAARFLIDKKVRINAGAVLISELHRANVPVGTPLEVTYVRKDGNTKIYSIKLIA
jgi:hypothetical protein